jgi:hypothetical protein
MSSFCPIEEVQVTGRERLVMRHLRPSREHRECRFLAGFPRLHECGGVALSWLRTVGICPKPVV